ncbi:hypothetical protein ROV36_03680 [Pasteurella multocida]|uniref:hypothetical protein n=1 Tax=Pasteurella multocida TaxID=747 RepID=UPI000DFB0724|nr:hypothetical protein [Pasteurella multocida]MEB3451393.1 hypothetical protein [Pasteurella multocida]MEB3453637.1 hypothetical protein [Pasteurella multocida]MEB3455786.1 hypothetical protein [Pasteurella multocida]MEB3459038.1 hypothetical protein [Pasteurella multocida]MEB3461316.1 hypothetical protein [Pasteurella multocida]
MDNNQYKMKFSRLMNNINGMISKENFKDKLDQAKKISKPVVISSMVFGGYITYQAENWIEQVRYPIKLEYSIISQCANGYNSGYLSSSSRKHIDTCICALEKTMNDVEPEQSSYVFNSEFKKNLYKCA